MAVRARAGLLGFCLLPLLTLCPVTEQAPQYGGQGSGTTLTPSIPGTPERILWKHDGSRLVEFDGSEEKVYGSFSSRVVLDWHTAALTVNRLRGEDSGHYELEVSVNSKLYYSHHTVEVIDEVASPSISCSLNDTGGSGAPDVYAMLACAAEHSGPPSLLEFEWGAAGAVHGGCQLSVPAAGKHDDAVYTCTVRNPVSEKTSEFAAKDCYPDYSVLTALIICAVICLLVLFAVVFLCYRRKKARAVQRETPDVEKHLFEGSENMLEEEKERQALLHNAATLPSSQRLVPPSRGGPLEEEPNDTTTGEHQEGREDPIQASSEPAAKPVETDSVEFEVVNEADPIGELEEEEKENEQPGSQPAETERDPLESPEETDSEVGAAEPISENRCETDVAAAREEPVTPSDSEKPGEESQPNPPPDSDRSPQTGLRAADPGGVEPGGETEPLPSPARAATPPVGDDGQGGLGARVDSGIGRGVDAETRPETALSDNEEGNVTEMSRNDVALQEICEEEEEEEAGGDDEGANAMSDAGEPDRDYEAGPEENDSEEGKEQGLPADRKEDKEAKVPMPLPEDGGGDGEGDGGERTEADR